MFVSFGFGFGLGSMNVEKLRSLFLLFVGCKTNDCLLNVDPWNGLLVLEWFFVGG